MYSLRRILIVSIVCSCVSSGSFAPCAQARSQQDCRDWQSCRQLATDARDRQDYEAFHDLAWKAVRLGPKNDPALMTMLARAQSMSGRPLDALVMLQRLASLGVITDAATSDDFERVRALPAWTDAAPKLSGNVSPETADTPSTAKPKPAASSKPAATDVSKPAEPIKSAEPVKSDEPVKPAAPPAATTTDKPAAVETPVVPPKAGRGSKSAAATKAAPSPLKFAGAGLNTVGLAYDAVSGRFIVGDRADRRLLVVGERSGRLSSLAGVDAGFNEVTAFEIDAKEGDLWVVSASSASHSSTVHKLQLISGRVLSSIALTEEHGPARFTDVAVTAQNVLVLDSEGRRIFRIAKNGRTLDVAMRLAVSNAAVLAPGPDGVVYVAYDQGLLRADLATRSMTVVEPAAKVGVGGITWMRWLRGSLVGIQNTAAGENRLVRIRLDESGRAARTVDVLEENVLLSGSSSAAISENVLYYLNRSPDSGDVIVRKVPLK